MVDLGQKKVDICPPFLFDIYWYSNGNS